MSLRVEHVTVYRQGEVVLHDISFTASKEFVLIAGPNGAGKTTLFLAILGVINHEGRICINGECGPERAQRIGYVPQILLRESYATVWEYVYLPAKFRKGREARRRAEEALRTVELFELRDRPITALSGGQLHRAAIARALAVGGEVLLLDEPLANVDPQGRVELLRLLRDLKKDKTILMTSHELSLPSDLADKILIVNKKLVAYGPPDAVLREEVLSRVYRYVKVAKTQYGYVCVTEDYGHH
ncbi:manganese ABC transporter ATP-binding protein [Pyrobaculum aerophilum str. IM2]|uniref:Manganese ABC transporter ATP-binding protein n=2 Tax=Pyrobaculum aerophilum TaxID=13773 RepID=Q8ZXJ7_PYRAE|nr:metal ABC transporter ATP-binding protein [Pyrobaculum aerophilum]AAL63350.1 manganese ABC transporter ATP-binding protein [Pyrobaculum aerophilum str. IM2]HII47710.1 metal ABC transporter ATP-binding protein [Pyrobaculum aerophilum]